MTGRPRLRVCSTPGCPALQPTPRCPTHQSQRERHQRSTVPTKVTRTHAERQRRAATVAAWREAHGDWCPGHGVPGHQSSDLTADHVQAVANGGPADGALAVLCRPCNARKGSRHR